MMDALLKDLTYALRALRAKPLFASVAVLSLAIGIGATTSMLSVMNVLAFRPLPGVAGWDRAVELGRTNRGRGFDTFTYPDFLDVREQVGALEEVAGWRSASFSMGTEEGGRRIQGQFVSANYFDALGVTPALGRFFDPEADTGTGRHPVAVVSDAFWRTHLDEARDAVGRVIRVNRQSLTVVGVAPRGFGGHMAGFRSDVYVPLTMAPALKAVPEDDFDHRGASWLQVIGRLAPGATVASADAQVAALFARLAEAHPETNARRSARVVPLGPIPGGGRGPVLGFMGALLGLVTLVLLVTCANVAGMFLARAASREREIAIRLAIGSGRARLVRQLLTEAVLVFGLGGTGGVLLAYWGMGFVDIGALPVPVELSLDLRPDLRVLALGLGVALLTGIAFGLAPALQAARTDVLPALKADGARGGAGASRLRRLFATGQVALSLVLLVAAGLFVRSLQRASALPRGFEPRGAYATGLDLDLEGYDREGGVAFLERLRARVAAIPGVEDAALGLDLPLDLASHGTGVSPEGWESPDGQELLGVDFNRVTPGWFAALGIPVLQGRGFDDGDRAGSLPVAVVSRAFAERVWPGESALGRRLRWGRSELNLTVVGVVEDTRNQTLMDAVQPFVYRPLAQDYDPAVTLVVRTVRPHGEVAPALRATLLEVDPSLSLTPVLAVDRLTSIGVLPQRIGASVAGFLGLVALVLCGMGLYGVVAFGVARRTREIGIRMALGAGASRVVGNVLRGAAMLALPGLAAGVALAAAVAVGLSRMNILLGVAPGDPATLAAVAGLLAAVVLVAAAVPASRAARVPPSEALRQE